MNFLFRPSRVASQDQPGPSALGSQRPDLEQSRGEPESDDEVALLLAKEAEVERQGAEVDRLTEVVEQQQLELEQQQTRFLEGCQEVRCCFRRPSWGAKAGAR